MVRRFEDLKPHAEAWDRLAAASPHQLPALSHAWVSTYLEHRLQEGESWCCLLAFCDTRLVGVLPLVLTPDRVLGFHRVLLRPPRDRHTLSVDAVVTAGFEEASIRAFLAVLDRVTPQWHAAKFVRLPSNSPTLAVADRKFSRRVLVCESAGTGTFVPTTGDFESYRNGLSRNFRKNLNKATRRLKELSEVRTEFLTEEADALPGLQRFMEVEASGWKGREGWAIARNPGLIDFYSSLVTRLARQGWLEWQFLVGDSRTLAGNLSVRCGRSMVVCKIGYDEVLARFAPGNLLMEQVIRRAFESRDIDKVDLVSDMAWHYNWLAEKRYYQTLWVYPCRPLSLVADFLPKRSRQALHRIPLLSKTVRRAKGVMKAFSL